jgi:flagellin-like hook-associated protein FlgL
MDSALNFPTDGAPPYGAETTESIEQLRFDNAFNRQQIKGSIQRETQTINFLQTSIGEVEDIDKLEAMTELLDIDRALQASYQVLARTQNLGLSNFL